MRTWICAVLVVSGYILASSRAIAQAAAEAALTHAMSTSAGTSIGTALGQATNQLAGRAAQRTSTIAPGSRVTTLRRSTRPAARAIVSPAASSPSTGSLIVSIQGGGPQALGCTPHGTPTGDVKAAPATSAAPQTCATQNPQSADAHPSVINLPAAQ
jgi:hypothetical protein